MSGAQEGREDLLRRAPCTLPIPSADLAHHDGGTNRVLGAQLNAEHIVMRSLSC